VNKFDRDTLYLLLAALGVGIVIGILLRGGGGRPDRSRIEDKKRVGTNLVFGNIVLGSNNAPGSRMDFGYEDTGDNS